MSPAFKFEWKANRNFCVTTKHTCDFETVECDEARDNGTFNEYALKPTHSFGKSTFKLVGYYKTLEQAYAALNETAGGYYGFLWDRTGKCVDGI